MIEQLYRLSDDEVSLLLRAIDAFVSELRNSEIEAQLLALRSRLVSGI